MARKPRYVALCISGPHLWAALFDNAGSPDRFRPGITPTEYERLSGKYDRDKKLVQSVVRSFTPRPDYIGMTVAGDLDVKQGVVVSAPNLHGWENRPLVRDLRRKFRCRTTIANDAEAEGLGHALYVANNDERVWYLLWDYGFGGSYVTPGNPPGVVNLEPGHAIKLDRNGFECGCGRRGCLEAYVSGAAIRNRFKVASPEELTKSQWSTVLPFLAEGVRVMLDWKPADRVIFGGEIACCFPQLVASVAARVRGDRSPNQPPWFGITRERLGAKVYGGLAIIARDYPETAKANFRILDPA